MAERKLKVYEIIIPNDTLGQFEFAYVVAHNKTEAWDLFKDLYNFAPKKNCTVEAVDLSEMRYIRSCDRGIIVFSWEIHRGIPKFLGWDDPIEL